MGARKHHGGTGVPNPLFLQVHLRLGLDLHEQAVVAPIGPSRIPSLAK